MQQLNNETVGQKKHIDTGAKFQGTFLCTVVGFTAMWLFDL